MRAPPPGGGNAAIIERAAMRRRCKSCRVQEILQHARNPARGSRDEWRKMQGILQNAVATRPAVRNSLKSCDPQQILWKAIPPSPSMPHKPGNLQSQQVLQNATNTGLQLQRVLRYAKCNCDRFSTTRQTP